MFLDLKADRYSAASGGVAARWRALTLGIDGANPPFGAVLPIARDDMDGAAAFFLEREFVTSDAPSATIEQVAPGSGFSRRLAAAGSIRRTAGHLKHDGFWSVYRETLGLRRRPAAHDLASSLDAFVAGENLTSLRQAPKDCLPRSLALYRYLLGCGIAARHVIGVQMRPFSAHAWVETAEGAVLEGKPPHHLPIARMSTQA